MLLEMKAGDCTCLCIICSAGVNEKCDNSVCVCKCAMSAWSAFACKWCACVYKHGVLGYACNIGLCGKQKRRTSCMLVPYLPGNSPLQLFWISYPRKLDFTWGRAIWRTFIWKYAAPQPVFEYFRLTQERKNRNKGLVLYRFWSLVWPSSVQPTGFNNNDLHFAKMGSPPKKPICENVLSAGQYSQEKENIKGAQGTYQEEQEQQCLAVKQLS